MKREIMKRAHEIARTMKGDYIARMSMALRMAWAEARKPKFVAVSVNYGWKSCYVAQIIGTHPKWKLDRRFLDADKKVRSYSGKTGYNHYFIRENGIYEKSSGGNKEYFIVENGTKKEIEYREVLELLG